LQDGITTLSDDISVIKVIITDDSEVEHHIYCDGLDVNIEDVGYYETTTGKLLIKCPRNPWNQEGL